MLYNLLRFTGGSAPLRPQRPDHHRALYTLQSPGARPPAPAAARPAGPRRRDIRDIGCGHAARPLCGRCDRPGVHWLSPAHFLLT